MNLRLDGRSALVTGAAGVLGSHFARTLASAGAKVALTGRTLEALAPVRDAIVGAGGCAEAIVLDVTDAASVARAFEQAAALLGAVTVVVNNAGMAVTKPLLEHTEEDWLQVIDVNLNGAWRVAQAAARHMVQHEQGGSIVNIASVLGVRVAAQVPSYTASKAALIHLTKAMALELARYRIRVNALAPGYIETRLNRDFFAGSAGEAMLKRVPQRRLGQPQELDGALLLLASDAGSYTTGAVFAIDGGHLVNTL